MNTECYIFENDLGTIEIWIEEDGSQVMISDKNGRVVLNVFPSNERVVELFNFYSSNSRRYERMFV